MSCIFVFWLPNEYLAYSSNITSSGVDPDQSWNNILFLDICEYLSNSIVTNDLACRVHGSTDQKDSICCFNCCKQLVMSTGICIARSKNSLGKRNVVPQTISATQQSMSCLTVERMSYSTEGSLTSHLWLSMRLLTIIETFLSLR